jgi:hypothetical protein
LHFRNWEAHLPLVRILNWRIDKDGFWTEFFDETPARRAIENLSQNIATERWFPIAGDHCSGCETQGCKRLRERFPNG